MKRHRQSGYTLVEVAVISGMSILIAAGLAAMIHIHFNMLRMAAQYRFLTNDAPTIGLLLTKTIANADDYRIYPSRTAALNPPNPPNLSGAANSGSAVRLWMRQANDNTTRQAILSYETINGNPGLYFFLQTPNTGNVYPANGNFPTSPSWQMAGSDLTGLTFSNTAPNASANLQNAPGILIATLYGANNQQISYAAEKK
jgi:hypothetical protein